jgi:hypothetical protein
MGNLSETVLAKWSDRQWAKLSVGLVGGKEPDQLSI